MTYTPGPWTVVELRTGNCWIQTADGQPVASVLLYGDALADARLMAASPDLLAALRAALDEIDGDDIGAVADVLTSKGRAAIAKAEGEAAS